MRSPGLFGARMASGNSILTRGQRRLLGAVVALGVLAVANTLYLLANRLAGWVGRPFLGEDALALPRFYQAMVLSHTGVGLLLVAGAVAFASWHLGRALRRRAPLSVALGALLVSSGIALAVTGLFIVTAANNRAHRGVFYAHVALGAVAVLLFALHRLLSLAPPAPGAARRGAVRLAGVLGVLVAVHAATLPGPSRAPDAAAPSAAERARADERPGRYLPPGFVPRSSPFFPSATTTASGALLPSRLLTDDDVAHTSEALARDIERHGFAVEAKVGASTCVRCHASIVDQWARSAHRYSSFNNVFYRATIEDMRTRVGFEKSKWCAGCHDPAIMMAGGMTREIEPFSAQAQSGLTCLACHAIDRIHDVTGNGAYNVGDDRPDPYIFAGAKTGPLAFVHDLAVKARPEVHKALMKKPFFATAEFCAACHKVSLDVPVNEYRWIRGQNDYDAWHDTGVAGNAARTFYLPKTPKVCQDCHMPPEPATLGDAAAKGGMVRSHRFLAVNTALPHVRGDRETIERTEAFLRDRKLRLDLVAMRGAGEAADLRVVVRNLGVGHTFPGGTNDSNEGWLHVRVTDPETGALLFESGAIAGDGYVDRDAHFYGAVLVDRHSQRIRRRNAQDIHSAIYANTIGPGTAQVVRYRFPVPPALRSRPVRVEVALRWRKFKREYTEFVFAEHRREPVPDLPVSTICETRADVGPGEEGVVAAATAAAGVEPWERFNDYGIGLLLQGDAKGAAAAFERVAALAPARVDGPRNLARVALQQGDLAEAYRRLARCEELAPADPQTAYFFGKAFLEDGRYAEAAEALARCLARFPQDRDALRSLGRARYLDGRHADAIAAFDRALEIDPEDRTAHYHRMLALRALGREDEAAAASEAYLKYQIDEEAGELQRSYRLANLADQRESQPIHVHEAPSR